MTNSSPLLPYEELCKEHALSFASIEQARRKADEQLLAIQKVLQKAGIKLEESFDASLSLLVFGSLARREWTSGSDVDWGLLVDGPTSPDHFTLISNISKALTAAKFVSPGSTGTFGALWSSHDLVHRIGGIDDTNINLTRRLLLVLESRAVFNERVRQRVLGAILNRYVVCGAGFRDQESKLFRVPRFLLNDVVRYWRTIAVDYAAKKWEQSNEKWAIRNAKLRLSRKLLFTKGLLLCFDCELFADASPWNGDLDSKHESIASVADELQSARTQQIAQLTPIDLVCRVLSAHSSGDSAKKILTPYDEFVKLIDKSQTRSHLESLSFEAAKDDEVFKKIRGIGNDFGDALQRLFFVDSEQLTTLTQKYGVF